MPSFDYEGYWLDVSKPRWEALDESVRKLVYRFRKDQNIAQQADCGIARTTVPDDLWAAVSALDSITLARAAVIAHDYNHFQPGPPVKHVPDPERPGKTIILRGPRPGEVLGSGGWKFALAATRILAERLELPEDAPRGQRNGLFVHRGQLRLFYRSQDSWRQEEIGLATPDVLDLILAWLQIHGAADAEKKINIVERDFDRVARQVRDQIYPTDHPDRHLVVHDPWQVSEEEEKWRREVRKARYFNDEPPQRPEPKSREAQAERLRESLIDSPLTLDRITQVNHRIRKGATRQGVPAWSWEDQPHPFVIGQKHMTGESVYLNPCVAPCAGCGYAYDDHESDTVAVIVVGHDVPDEQVKKDLQLITNQLTVYKIDGCVFVRPAGEPT